jgi:hypothetical protein
VPEGGSRPERPGDQLVCPSRGWSVNVAR